MDRTLFVALGKKLATVHGGYFETNPIFWGDTNGEPFLIRIHVTSILWWEYDFFNDDIREVNLLSSKDDISYKRYIHYKLNPSTLGNINEYEYHSTQYLLEDSSNSCRLHRLDGPAVEWAKGGKEWWVEGQIHRDPEDGPAFIDSNGTDYSYWWYDQLHNPYGPALVNKNESLSYINGKLIGEDERPDLNHRVPIK